MKIPNLRKRIYQNLVVSFLLISILSVLIIYDSYRKESSQKETQQIQSEILSIKNKTDQIKLQISESKKYQELWKNIGENKKFVGSLKIDDITSQLDQLADKYSIQKVAIKMTIPENLNESLFRRSTINVGASQGNLTFEAASDIKAIAFISDFAKLSKGYIVISNFDMKRNKKYTNQDLIQLSEGKISGAISVKMNFFWYSYKPYENNPNQELTTGNSSKRKAR